MRCFRSAQCSIRLKNKVCPASNKNYIHIIVADQPPYICALPRHTLLELVSFTANVGLRDVFSLFVPGLADRDDRKLIASINSVSDNHKNGFCSYRFWNPYYFSASLDLMDMLCLFFTLNKCKKLLNLNNKLFVVFKVTFLWIKNRSWSTSRRLKNVTILSVVLINW